MNVDEDKGHRAEGIEKIWQSIDDSIFEGRSSDLLREAELEILMLVKG